MAGSTDGEVTALLLALTAGRAEAWDELMPAVYSELKRLAHRQLRRETPADRLQTTALVHEAYLTLVDQQRAKYADRAHFFAVASTAMRRILVDAARARTRQKRGSGVQPVSIEGLQLGRQGDALDVVALGAALERLDATSRRARQVVECRVFGGLTIDETAVALGVAPMTVKRDWRMARAWLIDELL